VVYHEIGGLTATTTEGKGNEEDLHKARVDEATVYNHHSSQFPKSDLTPVSPEATKSAAWKDSVAAANDANGKGDIGLHAIIYDATANYPQTKWMQNAYGVPDHVHGPFTNSGGGGDVKMGDSVEVIIMKDLSPREILEKHF
jgi:hypothetical protein